jgi:predicted LPLAT superfamily acyltransferase
VDAAAPTGFALLIETATVRVRMVTRRKHDWIDVAERGSMAGLWFVAGLATLLGRRPARAFLRPLALYYTVSHRGARRASRDVLTLVNGRATPIMQYRHMLRFSQCSLDRLFFLRGAWQAFEIHEHGEEHLRRTLDQGRGALLLGAHLGCYEAMQRLAEARGVRVNVVGDFRNARGISTVLERFAPAFRARLVELDPDDVSFVLRIREMIEEGELVALLADRAYPDGRTAEVELLGRRARLPTGPYALAAALGCPVLLTFALHRPPNRYDVYCEPFADRVEIPRRGRDAALAGHAQRFADRVSHYCRIAPDNWFNFYDFWDDGGSV